MITVDLTNPNVANPLHTNNKMACNNNSFGEFITVKYADYLSNSYDN